MRVHGVRQVPTHALRSCERCGALVDGTFQALAARVVLHLARGGGEVLISCRVEPGAVAGQQGTAGSRALRPAPASLRPRGPIGQWAGCQGRGLGGGATPQPAWVQRCPRRAGRTPKPANDRAAVSRLTISIGGAATPAMMTRLKKLFWATSAT